MTAINRIILTMRLDLRSERGANLIEYALLIALIAIVCAAAVALLGGSTNEPLSKLDSQLGS